MNKVPCEAIRDLLPSYIDGLTSEVTNGLIEEHLKECADCAAAYASMRVPEGKQTRSLEEKKEIDFLKKNRKKNLRVRLFSVFGALALILLVLLARAFMVGSGDYTSWAAKDLEVNGKELSFYALPADSASAIAKLSYTEQDGVVTIKARSVLTSFLHRGGKQGFYTAEQQIREVRCGNRILWADGATVSAQASEVFATRHLYVGDMSANVRTANAMNIVGYLGNYKNELETAQPPYGWRLVLENDVSASERERKERDMDAFGMVLVGLIDNLDHVTFVYSADGQSLTRTIYASDASAFFGEDIKNCGGSVRALDRLMEKLGLDLYAAED